jgi:hypothetical protein
LLSNSNSSAAEFQDRATGDATLDAFALRQAVREVLDRVDSTLAVG